MSWNKRIRQSHRWISIAFTLGFVANIVATLVLSPEQQQETMWIGLFALVPLLFLLFTGLYLFALPYLSRNETGSQKTDI